MLNSVRPVRWGLVGRLQIPLPFMNRLKQTQPVKFSILPYSTFLSDSVFLYFNNLNDGPSTFEKKLIALSTPDFSRKSILKFIQNMVSKTIQILKAYFMIARKVNVLNYGYPTFVSNSLFQCFVLKFLMATTNFSLGLLTNSKRRHVIYSERKI
jgi:hypothetical protein